MLQRLQTTKSTIQLILLRADLKLMAILFVPLLGIASSLSLLAMTAVLANRPNLIPL